MKKIAAAVLCLLLVFLLTGCGKYISSYKAFGFVHSNEKNTAFMSFYSFDGKMVFKLKSSGAGELKYSARLESGSASVYYDKGGDKIRIFSLNSGEEINSQWEDTMTGTVYVIVETDGKCLNGDLHFSLE